MLAMGSICSPAFAAEGPEAMASAKAKLRLKSFTADRTIPGGGATTLTSSCREGFRLHSTRFNLIGVDPQPTANPASEPALAVVGVAPEPRGVTLELRNMSNPRVAVTVRGVADCAKVSGRVAGRRAGMNTYIATAKKRIRGGAARAAGTKRVKVKCGRRNSIPSDIGFESRHDAFVGASFFKRRGRIGVKGEFRTGLGPDKAKLHLVCQKGRGLQFKGAVKSGVTAAREPRVATSRKPKLKVIYARARGEQLEDSPFPGMVSVFSQKPRVYWAPPTPVQKPEGALWSERAYLDPGAVGALADPSATVPPGGRSITADLGFKRTLRGPNVGDFFAQVFIGKLASQFFFEDERSYQVLGGGQPPPPPSQPPPPGGSDPECSDGDDNADPEDSDADISDPGCYTGPSGAYDPDDDSEKHVADFACPPSGSTSVSGFLQINHKDKSLIGHTLLLDETLVHDGLQTAHSEVDLGELCGPGSSVKVSFIPLSGGGGRVDFNSENPTGDGSGETQELLLALRER